MVRKLHQGRGCCFLDVLGVHFGWHLCHYFYVSCCLAGHMLYYRAVVCFGQVWNEVAWFEQAVDITLFVMHGELLAVLDVLYRTKEVCIVFP